MARELRGAASLANAVCHEHLCKGKEGVRPGLELSSFVEPDHEPGSPTAMANELGLRNVSFEVDDLQATVDQLAADGYGLVGGIGQYENIWRMAYVRGPEGIIVSLADAERVVAALIGARDEAVERDGHVARGWCHVNQDHRIDEKSSVGERPRES